MVEPRFFRQTPAPLHSSAAPRNARWLSNSKYVSTAGMATSILRGRMRVEAVMDSIGRGWTMLPGFNSPAGSKMDLICWKADMSSEP